MNNVTVGVVDISNNSNHRNNKKKVKVTLL